MSPIRSWHDGSVDLGDVELRNRTYSLFVELGHAPTTTEVADDSGTTVADVEAGWRRLHDQHALVLSPGTKEIRIDQLNPRHRLWVAVWRRPTLRTITLTPGRPPQTLPRR